MYSQLRSQYPTASLTSDLLVAEPSHYVVQAVVRIGGTALATGLSSASTVEAAEDQARARALMILGITPSSGLSSPSFAPDVQMLEDSSHELPPGAPAQLSPAVQSEPESDGDWNWSEPFQPGSPEYFPEEALEPPPPPGLDEALPRPTKGPRKASPKVPKRGRSKQKPEPIDLSDVIAQTDIELKRLGWTHVQGRKFLEQTYGKRSRQQLTDSELLEFLEYLKDQSAVQDPPF
ncbi:MAG: hypothetical protein AAGB01_07700 [Cyanobacteria bacterium P01_F01_bin.42]